MTKTTPAKYWFALENDKNGLALFEDGIPIISADPNFINTAKEFEGGLKIVKIKIVKVGDVK